MTGSISTVGNSASASQLSTLGASKTSPSPTKAAEAQASSTPTATPSVIVTLGQSKPSKDLGLYTKPSISPANAQSPVNQASSSAPPPSQGSATTNVNANASSAVKDSGAANPQEPAPAGNNLRVG